MDTGDDVTWRYRLARWWRWQRAGRPRLGCGCRKDGRPALFHVYCDWSTCQPHQVLPHDCPNRPRLRGELSPQRLWTPEDPSPQWLWTPRD